MNNKDSGDKIVTSKINGPRIADMCGRLKLTDK